jgi:hypothetical protein
MRRALLALLAFVLVPAMPAEAKFSSARVCGADDCRMVTLDDGHKLLVIAEPVFRGADVSRPGSELAKPSSPPPAVSGWYRVTLCPGRCSASGARSMAVAPSAGYEYLGARGWVRLDQSAARVYGAVTRNLEPVPASGPAPDDSAHNGFPAWAWIPIAAAVVGVAGLVTMRRLKRPAPSPSAP